MFCADVSSTGNVGRSDSRACCADVSSTGNVGRSDSRAVLATIRGDHWTTFCRSTACRLCFLETTSRQLEQRAHACSAGFHTQRVFVLGIIPARREACPHDSVSCSMAKMTRVCQCMSACGGVLAPDFQLEGSLHLQFMTCTHLLFQARAAKHLI